MGLPEINIELKAKASTIIKRSSRGIVLLLLKDDTNAVFTQQTYKTAYDNGIIATNWNEKNIDYIQKAFIGKPSAVICVKIFAKTSKTGETSYTLADTLATIKSIRFNYMAMPEAAAADVKLISDWIKTQRNGANKKTFKAVLANSAGDEFGVINFTTSDIVADDKNYTTAEYTARLAGIFAGISLERSATYYVLDEVTTIKEIDNPDTAIDSGQLILINDGEKIKIGRAVNSKTTLGDNDKSDMKKIKIIEGSDMVCDDIRSTFADGYVGKVGNSYDNKVAFCAAVNSYLKDITKEGVLYDKFDNLVSVDIAAQEKYLKEQGIDTSSYNTEKLKNANTGSKVFVTGHIQFQDAMEDLTMTMTI